jgi:hypothetical protein
MHSKLQAAFVCGVRAFDPVAMTMCFGRATTSPTQLAIYLEVHLQVHLRGTWHPRLLRGALAQVFVAKCCGVFNYCEVVATARLW